MVMVIVMVIVIVIVIVKDPLPFREGLGVGSFYLIAFAPNTPNRAVNTAIANSTIFFQLIFFIIYKNLKL